MLLPPEKGYTKKIVHEYLAKNPELAERFKNNAAEMGGMASAVAVAMASNEATGKTPDMSDGDVLNQIDNTKIRENFEQSYFNLVKTFQTISPDLRIPELSELDSVNWEHLANAASRLENADVPYELVIAPIDLSIDEWNDAYSNLHQWQDINDPDAPDSRRLQDWSDGDGLYWSDMAKKYYDGWLEYTLDKTPGAKIRVDDHVWQATIVPAGIDRDSWVTNIQHTLDNQHDVPAFKTLSDIVDPDLTYDETSAHMPIGTYLAMQAKRIYNKQEALGQDTYTWLAGVGGSRAPNAGWRPSSGRVYVYGGDVGDSLRSLGARLLAWG
jgi:hypothetical protein